MITQLDQELQLIQSYLKYEPFSGQLIWIKSPGKRAKLNSVAGHKNAIGYIEVRLKGKLYLGHRLTWLLCNLEWPSENLDHIDRKRDHNRIENLRLCSQSQNGANSSMSKNNTSGYRGVVTAGENWRAQINNKYKNICLGTFKTKEEAAEAYNKAAIELYKEFAVLNEVSYVNAN
ncbi:MAG: HNH endonuclease [Pseudomonadota bacterium]|jgi:hypothetical protein